MKRIALLLAALSTLGALVMSAAASAAPDRNAPVGGVTSPSLLALITNDDVFSTIDLSWLLGGLTAAPLRSNAASSSASSNATQHYGPYTTQSADSGTCGNDWANDTFDRHFTVKPNNDGTFTVVEQFKNGSFVTTAGLSPGACETNVGGTVAAGVTGSMHGYFIIQLPSGSVQSSQDPRCTVGASGPCNTDTFIGTHFTPGAYSVSTFFFHYSAGSQGLAFHEWKNAHQTVAATPATSRTPETGPAIG